MIFMSWETSNTDIGQGDHFRRIFSDIIKKHPFRGGLDKIKNVIHLSDKGINMFPIKRGYKSYNIKAEQLHG